ncbi:MocR-like pyridoxine biosynthesis transcription factor PdxR [Chitinibacter tainanensis]|uniref:MocR-like pyridoxine biosynthesis transcription factor PdxR n=1 Tax=Chitinibacter tainanensis TaxID=230667 RepID=UPI0003FC0B8F|nr:PLP-dependent aminotransferase family protein [Chitinibacter tainanensis]
MDFALLLHQFAASNARSSRQQQLYTALRSAILQRTLAPLQRLPASRQLARELSIARNAVVFAYEQLASEGLLESGPRGTRVAALPAVPSVPHTPQRGLSQRGQAYQAPFADVDTLAPFTPGVPALAEFDHARWQRLLAKQWRTARPSQLAYGQAAGEPALREAIAGHLRAARGVVCDASQVLITDGTQASLDLCAKLFADVGDVAWVEDPGYGGAVNAFTSAQLAVRGIAVDADGIKPSAADWQTPPQLIYVTPSHQYPLGHVLSLPRRLALLAQAQQHGTLIIEDDYDSEFRRAGPPLPAMQGLLPDAPVLYLGTFSKSLFPALRTGYLVVPRAYVQAVTAMLAQCYPRGRQLEQLALAEFIQSGEYAAHLRRMRKLYSQRRDALSAALERHFGPHATLYGGAAGMHLALELSPEFDASASSQQAIAHGLIARPLAAYCWQAEHRRNGFILGYAQIPVEEVDGLVRRLASYAGIP